MKILYFAWLRQKIGHGEETVDLPDDVNNVNDLVIWLKSRGDNFKDGFKDTTAIKVAVNQEFSDFQASITSNDEIAFFPPVTGG